MPSQGKGAPFLERVLRTGRKWQGLMNVDYPGGMGSADPHSIGGTAAPPPRPTPSGEQMGTPAPMPSPALQPAPSPSPMPSAGASPAAPMPGQAEVDFPFPWLDEDLPGNTLAEVDLPGQVLPAITLGERFYRRYGRMPGPLETWLNVFRQRFETQMGRPPTKVEVESALNTQDREDMEI